MLVAEGSGTTDQIAAGVRYAADKGADVINLSLGFISGVDQVVKVLGLLDPVYAAFDYANSKGAVIVVAAGKTRSRSAPSHRGTSRRCASAPPTAVTSRASTPTTTRR